MATFAERLIKLRKEKGLTQDELAEATGNSKSTIASWETGRRQPTTNTFRSLAKFLEVKAEYLKGEDFFRTNEEHSYPAYWDNDEFIEVIKKDIEQLTYDEKSIIYDTVQQLKKRHQS